jgi:hypothetical protein
LERPELYSVEIVNRSVRAGPAAVFAAGPSAAPITRKRDLADGQVHTPAHPDHHPVMIGMVFVIFYVNVVAATRHDHDEGKIKQDVIETLRKSMHLDDPFWALRPLRVGRAAPGTWAPPTSSRPRGQADRKRLSHTMKLAVLAPSSRGSWASPSHRLRGEKKQWIDHSSWGFRSLGIHARILDRLILQNAFKNVLPVVRFDSCGT